MTTLLPNEPTVGCSEAALQCGYCDVRIRAAWLDEGSMSSSAASLFADFRRVHGSHPEYGEALPILGRQVPVADAPEARMTLYDRRRMSANEPAPYDNAPPPSPPLTAPPAPMPEEDGGGESPPNASHYPGF